MSIPKKIRQVDKATVISRTTLTCLNEKLTYGSVKLDRDFCIVSDFIAIIDVISYGTEAVVRITQSTVIITGIRGGGFNDNCMIWTGRDGRTHATGLLR